jgi:multimeric flavodoxin WrbA
MKVVAFNGSPHKNGNTMGSIQIVLAQLREQGIETEVVQLGGNRVSGCTDCGYCKTHKDMKCAIKDDVINNCIAKMAEADGIIIGSPVYFGNVTTEVKALIDRAGRVTRNNDMALRRKVGAAVIAVRRAGSNFTYAAVNFLFGISEMIVAHSSYWNVTLSRDIGDLQKDAEGMATFETLGKNMAWLLSKTAE